jgi:monofunctional biosynthetic peptidoglycan transglycosylase
VRWVVRILVATAAAVAAFLLFELATWPDVAKLGTGNPESTAFLDRWNERERAAGRAGARLRFVPYARISAELKVAVVAAEDIDFFSHGGFAVGELKKSVAEAWEDRELPRGASTITQQLAKNLWLSPSRNPLRKAKEALLTRQLERHLTKRRILELYLNVAEWGEGVFGAEAAARHYFGVGAANLSPGQAARLAAMLPRPRFYDRNRGSRYLATYTERILARMPSAQVP